MERFNDLTELLDSIQSQTYRNFEITIVTEKSRELHEGLEAYVGEKGYTNTRVIFNSGPEGLSQARNIGIRAAQGDIITFLDDDAIPFPDWLANIVKTFLADDSIIGVTGVASPLWRDEALTWFPEEFYWMIGCTAWSNLTETTEVRNVWGANMSFTRDAFTEDCIFNEDDFGSSIAHEKGKTGLICDDTELSLRIKQKTKKRLVCNPEIKIWHKVYAYRLNPRFIRRYAYQHAYSKAVIKQNYDNGTDNVLSREYALLKQILLKLIPNTIVRFPVEPRVSWRKLSVTANVLLYSALGYFAAIFRERKDIGTLQT
jgi:GT2 family glycosyltransferase